MNMASHRIGLERHECFVVVSLLFLKRLYPFVFFFLFA